MVRGREITRTKKGQIGFYVVVLGHLTRKPFFPSFFGVVFDWLMQIESSVNCPVCYVQVTQAKERIIIGSCGTATGYSDSRNVTPADSTP